MVGDILLVVNGEEDVISLLLGDADSARLSLQRTQSSTAPEPALSWIHWSNGQETALFIDYEVALSKGNSDKQRTATTLTPNSAFATLLLFPLFHLMILISAAPTCTAP